MDRDDVFIQELYDLLKRYSKDELWRYALISESDDYDGGERYCGTHYWILDMDMRTICDRINEMRLEEVRRLNSP